MQIKLDSFGYPIEICLNDSDDAYMCSDYESSLRNTIQELNKVKSSIKKCIGEYEHLLYLLKIAEHGCGN